MINSGGYKQCQDDLPASERHLVALAHELAKRYELLPAPGVSADFIQLSSAFDLIYKEYPTSFAKMTSRQEREGQGHTDASLVYGEISFGPFSLQIQALRENHGILTTPGGIFVDVGCGSGKPVIAAALLHDFDVCMGIEILHGLHSLCLQVKNHWEQMKTKLSQKKQNMEIRFMNGDATVIDWSDADVVFMNSTCFDDTLMRALAGKCEELKPGSIVITTTRRLPSSLFEILEQNKMNESWGEATVFIQRLQEVAP